jgi:plasmid stabilization system protein ParE
VIAFVTLTRRFPYLIFYAIDPKESVVLAVLHASRDSRLWP